MIAPNKPGWVQIKGPCPACQHSDGFCTRSADGEVVKCRRVESPRPVREDRLGPAWLHAAAVLTGSVLSPVRPKAKPVIRTAEWANRQAKNATAINPQKLNAYAKGLGVSARSLRVYQIGWDIEFAAWSFPMFDVTTLPNKTQRIICGMHLRRWPKPAKGKDKLCVPGSQLGLFIPDDYDTPGLATLPEDFCADPVALLMLLLLPEGVSDCCAARDLGFRAVGRPSCAGGAYQVRRLLETSPPQDVVAVADRDAAKIAADGKPHWPGIEGAVSLCEQILSVCRSLRFVLPPDGAKDLRAWANAGPVDALSKLVFGASPVSPAWLKAARKRIEDKRVEVKR